MKKANLSVLALMVFAYSASLSAYDFGDADRLFKQRENNLSAIAEARGLYERALNSSTVKEEQIYAAEQLGKLAYYEGELLTPEDSHSKRVEIFSQCMDYAEKISPDKVGETAAHYYWKTVCMALWGRSASKLSVLWRLGELKATMKRGLEFDSNYAGGGMHRVVATIKIRAGSIGGLYDAEGALQHVDAAIAKGPEFYNSYIVKAEILNALGRSDEALSVLESAKRDIEGKIRTNKLPLGYEAEAKAFLKMIRNALRG